MVGWYIPNFDTLASENTARILLAAQISDFACVMMGAGSRLSIPGSLESMMRGFSDGMQGSGRKDKIRSVAVVEYDDRRFQQMTQAVVELAVSNLLDGVEITIEIEELASNLLRRSSISALSEEKQPLYLIVRQETLPDDNLVIEASLLTAGGKATVLTDRKIFHSQDFDDILDDISKGSDSRKLSDLGQRLGELVIPFSISELLVDSRVENPSIVVLHDAESSKVPWEIIRFDDFVPVLEGGMSRRFMADLPISKWHEKRADLPSLQVLLIADPSKDLPGAMFEGERILNLLEERSDIQVTSLFQEEATWNRVFDELGSGKYDIVHYAGHAFFDPVNRSRSGLVCHEKRVLSGEDLAGLGNLPALVFFNACEAGRIRNLASQQSNEIDRSEKILGNVSLSEAFLRGGVANYIGTYWRVGDTAAKEFATAFYPSLLAGDALGDALNAGRKAVKGVGSPDWADYMHYGTTSFRLKHRL